VVAIPIECEAPALIADHDAPAGPETNTGNDVDSKELFPTCPDVFCPHPYKLPTEVIPSECDAPAAIAVHDAPAGPATNTGDDTVAP